MHYWFVESEDSVENDPVVLWLNGGPGASSLMGFFTEFGPLIIDGEGSVFENPYTFSKKGKTKRIRYKNIFIFSCTNYPFPLS